MLPKLTIVTNKPDAGGAMKTQGTEIYLDGQKIDCCTEVQLVAETNGIWQARLTLNACIEFKTHEGGGG